MSESTTVSAAFEQSPGCPQCGAPVGLIPSDVCPQCGGETRTRSKTFDDELTLLLDESLSNVPGAPPNAAADQELNALIGADIDVYHIDSLLGRGGMGHVFLAHHRDLHRPCALKILSPRLAARDADYVQRFLNEGRAAAALVHPNVITIHAIGQARQYYFLEMEFVAGRSLRQVLDEQGPLPPLRAATLAARVADGLAAAHRELIIHRDLKADNVLLTLHNVPKIADFGLCKRIQRGGSSPVPEGLCGTPNYMAPELFQGEPASPASDVYGLGVMLYLMLAARFPFSAASLPELVQIVTTRPPPDLREFVADIPLEIAECVNLLLEKSPANRPADGHAAAALVHAMLGQVRDLYALIEEAFRDDPHVQWVHAGEQFHAKVRFADGRKQVVHIEPSQHAADERLLLIYSTCCAIDPTYYETALRLNAEMPHGSVAIREVDGQAQFVVLDTYPRATVDAEEIRRSTLEVAARADAIEQLLTGLDHR